MSLEKLKGKLQGKKTYVIALLAMIISVLAWKGGSITLFQTVQTVLIALLFITMKAGIVRVTIKLSDVLKKVGK